MAATEWIEALGPVCRDGQRRADIHDHPILNGIDYVEYELRGDEHLLLVNFLKPLSEAPDTGGDGAYGLTTNRDRVRVLGGTRIPVIQVLEVRLDGTGDRLEILVDGAGDFSGYWLLLGWRREEGRWSHEIAALDPPLSIAPFGFKAGCPVEFDCREQGYCPPGRIEEPAIDYLAKDYASFRRLLLDSLPRLNPDWLERNPADLGIALVELLAHAGDHLSYFQDAVANEAYLETARQRVSAKRHARLIDYRMHDGRNAWTLLHISVSGDGIELGEGTQVLSRVTAPLRRQPAAPGPVIAGELLEGTAFESDPALSRALVFETAASLSPHPENNEILLHDWGNLECCIPGGTTGVYLYSRSPAEVGQAIRPTLQVGDYLLLEEVVGPVSGAAADADPVHRQVVRLIGVEETEDPAYANELDENGRPRLWATEDGAEARLPLLQVTWGREDALEFPLCLSTRLPGGEDLTNVSVARGNMVPADHGRTLVEVHSLAAPVPADRPFRLALRQAPVTLQCRPSLAGPPRAARPAVELSLDFPTGTQTWSEVPDLLDSPPLEQHFVVDLDHEGRATLRFGDGEYGREPAGATGVTATYRIGNGRAGSLGAEALAHVVQPEGAAWSVIQAVRNPLPARDGADPETIEEVRQLAPAAFHAEQFRAVTEADYRMTARRLPEVAGAVASFRWTGSWYTVLVGVDPRDPADLITEPGGRTRLAPALRRRVHAFLTRYRLAGYDLEIRTGQYVPLEIDIELCVAPYHFRGDVAEVVRQALSNRVLSGGVLGFFHPERFNFGQAVHLSRLYRAIEAVDGVDSAVVTRFHRYGKLEDGELDAGRIPIGPWEIARLDNDPNFMENGVLRITAQGGK